MIVVTGGAGFIGSAIVWRLNALGRNDILVVDLPGTENHPNLRALSCRDFLAKEEFAATLERVSLWRTVYAFRSRWLTPALRLIHANRRSSTAHVSATATRVGAVGRGTRYPTHHHMGVFGTSLAGIRMTRALARLAPTKRSIILHL